MKNFLFAILTLSLLTACTSGEKPPTYAELQQHQQITGTAAAEPETEVETLIPPRKKQLGCARSTAKPPQLS